MSQLPLPPRNRRLSPRRPAKRSVRVTCQKGALGLGPDLAVTLLDLSETGARLTVKEALPNKLEVEVGLMAQGQGRAVKRLANVVWCAAAEGGNHCIGVRFQKALTYAELQQLA